MSLSGTPGSLSGGQEESLSGTREAWAGGERSTAGGPCPACGAEPATGPDRVDHRERTLWDALDRAERLGSPALRPVGLPSEIVRARDEALRAATAGAEAQQALAVHLDHLLAAYAQMSAPPFWFVYGFGLPTGPKGIADWATRSRALLGHRRRYGITDPLRPLGECPPEGSAQAARWTELVQHPSSAR